MTSSSNAAASPPWVRATNCWSSSDLGCSIASRLGLTRRRVADDRKSAKRLRGDGRAMLGFIFFDVATRLVAVPQQNKVEEVPDRGHERCHVGHRCGVKNVVYPGGFLAAADHSHFAEDDLRSTGG